MWNFMNEMKSVLIRLFECISAWNGWLLCMLDMRCGVLLQVPLHTERRCTTRHAYNNIIGPKLKNSRPGTEMLETVPIKGSGRMEEVTILHTA